MKKIIIPVDFSKYSEYALKSAASLARKYGAELTVMHMLELSDSIFSSSYNEKGEEMAFMLMLANQKFDNFLDKDYLEGLTVTPVIKKHKVLKEVNDFAASIQADLIVMGSKGHSDQDGVFTGSNTEKVVRHSDIPVLVIKEELDHTELKAIVLATDFDSDSVPATKNAVTLLESLGIEVSFLHVNLPNIGFMSTDEIQDRRNSFLEVAGHPEWSDRINYVADYSVEDGVLKFANNNNADAIAVISHGRTGLNLFFGGSISEDVVNHARLPVITFKQ
ncbi:universal stress protein [Winogradskyella aurantiaca]|uniref:universal stress protein n=1 Tax=Winogradskyella aurantiaca TaxID=2219558 RepID=UPI000E1DCC1C|nr:universal stress protein [Winogradskyella aurantiaca]